MSTYITTSIPYVNARPHVGHALEFLQADVLARHRRARGEHVRLLSGTDDNAIKNVRAASDAGVDVATFVGRNARAFYDLCSVLDISNDDFIQTGSDPRHVPAVNEIWRRCREAGDLYEKDYSGLYCNGCEQFVSVDELTAGRCAEHGVEPEIVTERNHLFRLSRYQERLLQVLESTQVCIQPEARRNEVLAFVRAGLQDFSVSRPAGRSGGWGVPVPDDPDQVVYVWFDALVNYISSLGFGPTDSEQHERWWQRSEKRVHVVGKGIVRFHAVYWLAILLSASEPLPTTIFVHEYLTANGAKISKSAGNAIDPSHLVERFGADALRWWLASDVQRVGDTDYSDERLVGRWNSDIVGGLGNLVNRVVTLVHLCNDGRVPERSWETGVTEDARAAANNVAEKIDSALSVFDLRSATRELLALQASANRLLEATRPWELRRSADPVDQALLREVLHVAWACCVTLARQAEPFVPTVSARLNKQLGPDAHGVLPEAKPLFVRL